MIFVEWLNKVLALSLQCSDANMSLELLMNPHQLEPAILRYLRGVVFQDHRLLAQEQDHLDLFLERTDASV